MTTVTLSAKPAGHGWLRRHKGLRALQQLLQTMRDRAAMGF